MTSVTAEPSDYLVIGSAPRPTTGAALDEVLQAFLKRIAAQTPNSVSGLESAVVRTRVDGVDISHLSLDLTGVAIRTSGEDAGSPELEEFGTVTLREEAVLREFTVRANPLVFQGVDFVIDGSVESLKFAWAVDDQSRLGVGESTEETGRLRIQLRAETNQQALVAAATELLELQLSDAGVSVSDVDVQLTSAGPRDASIVASAKIRKGILGASAKFQAQAAIDDAMVLRITEPQLSSKNPLVAALLLVTRDRITEAVAAPIDLNESLPDSLHLRDVAFELGEKIRVDLSFG